MLKISVFLFTAIWAVVLIAATPINQEKKLTQTQKPFPAIVLRVYDGDTVLVRYNGLKWLIRLWGIDTPERKQTGGKKATKYLISLIRNKMVKVIPVKSGKYGRLIAKLYYRKVFVNLEMVKAGHAWWYKQYAPNAKEFEKVQKEAKAKKLGIWANDNPVNPSKWRHSRN